MASSQISLDDGSRGTVDAGDLLLIRSSIGFDLPLGQFFLDADGTWGSILAIGDLHHSIKRHTPIIQARLMLGFKLCKVRGVSVGGSYNVIL